jgi:beta-lactamase class A
MPRATTTRRKLMLAAAAAAAMTGPALARPSRHRFDAAQRLRALETGAARLGVCLLDAASGEVTGNRLDERFAMCSTFKLAMVAACLRETDAGRLDLAEVLPYSEADLLEWAPVTTAHVGQGGLSIRVLAQA